MHEDRPRLTRRRLLQLGIALPLPALLAACDGATSGDQAGGRLRDHQFTDADGRFRLETVVPGLYTGRTRHIHVKVQAPNRPVLTTQLYFPGEAANAADGIFREELLLAMSGDRQASFTFVLSV